jgi:hypothetical protein
MTIINQTKVDNLNNSKNNLNNSGNLNYYNNKN